MEIKILGAFLVGVGIAVFIGGYLIARTIRQYDESIKDLYNKRDTDRRELDILIGEHNTISGQCKTKSRK